MTDHLDDTVVVPPLPRFAASLRTLASQHDVDEALQLAVDLAAELVRGCRLADVMFIRRGGTSTPVSTDPLAIELDRIQSELGEGPCLAASAEEPLVVSNDLQADPRWPTFAARAEQHGIRSVLSLQLYLQRRDDDRFGALNLYGGSVDAFDATSIQLGELFAAHCSAVLAAAVEREGYNAALLSRDLIGQAKGILMVRRGIGPSEAFALLREHSQRRNVKLRDLAETVAATGQLPT